MLDDGKPQSCSAKNARDAAVGLAEWLKDAFMRFFRDARACVIDFYSPLDRVVQIEPDAYLALFGELNGIAGQVGTIWWIRVGSPTSCSGNSGSSFVVSSNFF